MVSLMLNLWFLSVVVDTFSALSTSGKPGVCKLGRGLC
jgi:hypothetical protein